MALPCARLAAIEPFRRTGPPRFLLSLAAYSFRDFFRDPNRQQAAPAAGSRRIDLFEFIDFCAAHGCDGAEVTSYYFPPDFDRAFLLRLKRHAFLAGVEISGTAVGNTFTHPPGEKRDREIAHVKRWIDHAAVLGAPHIRIFAGDVSAGVTKEAARDHCIRAMEECCAYAAEQGVVLGLENHGGIVAGPDGLLDLVRAVRSPALGVNLDTGNFHTADPYADLERCAPYAVNVQFKAEIRRSGQKESESADFGRVLKILRGANYQGYVALEYESKEDPWTAVPRLLKQMREALG
jgi:sugar phosphate isomerase/epimerase